MIEEFIEGQEYSIEGIHYNGEHHVIQYTEKITTPLPYNVELGHIQPADLTINQKEEINSIISGIAKSLKFMNCASHSELKINSKGIYVIETSPRLGGDFISSTLVPLSTGINMEDILIDIATNHSLQQEWQVLKFNKNSGIKYFELSDGVISEINGIENLDNIPGIQQWYFGMKPGERVNKITSSLERYGYAIFQANSRKTLIDLYKTIDNILANIILINKYSA